MKLKASKYNYFVENGEKIIIFNGLTERFFEVGRNRHDSYMAIFEDPEEYYSMFKSFLDRMHSDGFVIDEKTDEENLLESKFRQVSRETRYYLMVLPTYQCNVRCWYCVQDHAEIWISDEIIDRLKKRVQSKLDDPSIKEFHLSWFGGEPLLAYNRVLEFTRYARETALAHGKEFTCEITTNGTLLNSERIEELHEAGVGGYQITIDGIREYHDRIKRLPGASAFDTTLKNIDELAKHTKCTLRFNYTHKNLKPDELIHDVEARLSEESRKNITFMLFKVWQEGEENVNKEDVYRLFDNGVKAGMTSRLPRCGMCYADHKHFDCVFPDGTCEKCDNESPDAKKGFLTPDGNVVWKDSVKNAHVTAFRQKKSECRTCRYLPLCWGPCVATREHQLRNEGYVHCFHYDKDSYIKGVIRDIVRNTKILHNDKIPANT